ncbi:MAG: hypothetical protein ACLTWW_07260 [Negativibacillus sp.]|nr:hypothetical protein [Clostridium sp.]
MPEKISTSKSESNAYSTTLTLCFLRKVARLNATHTLIRGIGEGVLSQRISYENIGQLRKFLLERSLFDNKRFGNKLFQSDTILTSTSIQRRFQLAVKSRASKNPVVVNPKFWLLSKEETQSFIKMHPILNNSEKNPRYSEKNPENSKNYVIKKSKENISRRSSKGEGRNFAVFCVKDNRRQKVLPKQMEQICTFILTVL